VNRAAAAAVNFIATGGVVETWCWTVIGVSMSGGDQLWATCQYIYKGTFDVVAKLVFRQNANCTK
jgi:hypothetical protein